MHRRRPRALAFGLTLSCAAPLRAEPPAPGPEPPAAPAERHVAPPPVRVTSRLARDTVSAALRAAGHPEARAKLSSMMARARTSAVIPELFLRASRSTDQSLRITPSADDPYGFSQAGGAGLWLEARLAWHLDRLVFDHDELAVERLRIDRADSAAKLAARVLETLFAWQRAVIRSGDPETSPEEREAAWLSKVEAEITLDVLTNGWFGTAVRLQGP